MRKLPLFAFFALVLSATVAGAVSPYPVTELFPAEPGINAQRGYAVAVDGDWLAMGAHRDDENGKDAGAVYLFQWSGTTWEQKKKLFAQTPQAGAQLGFSLAMRDGVLAAGALGEGVVYTFALQGEDVWVPTGPPLTGPPRAFGRSLALDGNRLAVGAVEGHGTTDGAVYLYDVDSWDLEQMVSPRTRQKRERFGSAVSLANDLLVAGAPGYDAGAGAVYVFRLQGTRWREEAKLRPPDSPRLADGQLGAAVATDGTEIFAGAPTADPAGPNSGAVYRFVQSGGDWDRQRLEVEAAPGHQLGASLALSGGLLVAGAPAPPPGTGSGKVHVLRRIGASWLAVRSPGARNAENRDLAGFAAAVDGERVVVGGALGDQGYGAAGATWSFRCPEEEACVEEAEAVARGDLSERSFGVSVALTEELMAVGAPEIDRNSRGAVYLYRQTGDEWRQEKRLTSAWQGDGFGSSVALEGSLLAVGAPLGRIPVSGDPDPPRGNVDLFVRRGSSWFFVATLPTPCGVTAGTSVAISDGVVAVGAPGCQEVYLFEKVNENWKEPKVSVLTDSVEGFGSAVSLRGGVLAIGAPGDNDGVGAAYIAVRREGDWIILQKLLGVPQGDKGFGSAVAVEGTTLAVGVPELNHTHLFKDLDGLLQNQILAPKQVAPGFGASLSLLGNRLAVGAPNPDDRGRVFLYELESVKSKELFSLEPLPGDGFGFAVALSSDFFVVTSPGRGDRVTTFKLPRSEGGVQ